MSSDSDAVQAFCNEIIQYLKGKQTELPNLVDSSSSQTTEEIQTLLKKTQKQVSQKIQTLLEIKKNGHVLLNLFVIDQTLYQLHQTHSKKERITLLHLCLTIEKSLNKHLKELAKQQKLAEIQYNKHRKRNNLFNFTSLLVGAISFISAFFNPEYAIAFFSIALICFTHFLILGRMWRNSAFKKLQLERKKSDPSLTKKALIFLKPEHLKALFEEKSYTSEYQQNYFKMLIALGKCFDGALNEKINQEVILETAKNACLLAYSNTKKIGNADIIIHWRADFEKIQKQTKELFGRSLENFNAKTKSSPLHFLEVLESFRQSSTRMQLQQFLHDIEFLSIEID